MAVPAGYGQRHRIIEAQLRALASSSVALGLLDPALLREAADTIDRLKKQVHDLEEMKSPREQFDAGYAKAQADIRDALGIEQ